MTTKGKPIQRLQLVQPTLEELLPTQAAMDAYHDALASIEAGRLVESMRRRAGLTQVELGARLDVSQARVSAIENGNGRDGPTYALLKRIARACDVEWPGKSV